MLLKVLIHKEIAQTEPECLLPQTEMQPGYLCKGISPVLSVPEKSLFPQILWFSWDFALWNCSTPLLRGVFTLGQSHKQEITRCDFLCDKTGFDDPLNLSALKADACFLGL